MSFIFEHIIGVRDNINIMKTIIGRTQLADEFKGRVRPLLRRLEWIGCLIPFPQKGLRSKGVSPARLHAVPVGDRKAQMLLHGLPGHYLVLVVKLEGKGIVRFAPLEGYPGDRGKIFLPANEYCVHTHSSLVFCVYYILDDYACYVYSALSASRYSE